MVPGPQDSSSGEQRSSGDGEDQGRRTSDTVREIIERTLLVGVGAAALTKDRLDKVAEEFVRKGQLSGDEGRELVQSLASRSRDEARATLRRADDSLQGTYRDLGLAPRKDLEDLDFGLRQIEHRLTLVEAQIDTLTADSSDDDQ